MWKRKREKCIPDYGLQGGAIVREKFGGQMREYINPTVIMKSHKYPFPSIEPRQLNTP